MNHAKVKGLKKIVAVIMACSMMLGDAGMPVMASAQTEVEENYSANAESSDITEADAETADTEGMELQGTTDAVETENAENTGLVGMDDFTNESQEQIAVAAGAVQETSAPLYLATSSSDIASGHIDNETEKGVDWVIDKNGKLTVSGTGNFRVQTKIELSVWGSKVLEGKYPAWCKYALQIKTAEINLTDATDASYMFYACTNMTSVDLSQFDSSRVTDMRSMFEMVFPCGESFADHGVMPGTNGEPDFESNSKGEKSALKQLDLSHLDTRNVTNMSNMFRRCNGLTELDVSHFNTENVTDMGAMFYCCNNLKTLDVSNFKTDKVTNMSYMFGYCAGLSELKLGTINTSQVTDMSGMFAACAGLKNLNVTGLNTGKTVSMSYMFYSCLELEALDLSGFDTKNVTNMEGMFSCCESLKSLDLSHFKTSNLTKVCARNDEWDFGSMHITVTWDAAVNGMFYGCSSLETLNLSGFDISKVESLNNMFRECNSLKELDLSSFKTDNVKGMAYMFKGCSSLEELDVSHFCTSKVTLMIYMFEGCTKLKSLDVGNFDTKLVYAATGMFNRCASLVSIDVSGFNLSGIDIYSENDAGLRTPVGMFTGCTSLKAIKVFKNLTSQQRSNMADNLPLPTTPMYDIAGNAYTEFPLNLSEGIWLFADKNPTAVQVQLADEETYTYTGSAVCPTVQVMMFNDVLTEGKDYTVAYTDNVNAGTGAVVVTGKGSLAGASATAQFAIQPKNLSDSDVVKPDITAESGEKAVPVLFYNGMALQNEKDYTKQFVASGTGGGTIVINGKGNYTGSASVKVTVADKASIRKIAVKMTLPEQSALVYDGTEKRVTLEVTDTSTKDKLTENKDYIIAYSGNVNAGTAKVTVAGVGSYSGVVKKSFAIKPLKAENVKVQNVNSAAEKSGYTYLSTGVTIDSDLAVYAAVGKQSAASTKLVQGRDYKIGYSNNKKAGTAKYTVSFLGNFKGTKAVTGTFVINPIGLSGADILVADKIYTGKAGTYVSVPYVCMNDVILKKSDYKCTYYLYKDLAKPISAKNPVKLSDSRNYVTVYVKIEGKGNYADKDGGYEVVSYKVWRVDDPKYNLTKAKVTITDANGKKFTKAKYTGAEIKPSGIQVTVGSGKKAVTVPASQYTVQYIGNINKGKAYVLITGSGSAYRGTKVASFKITASK